MKMKQNKIVEFHLKWKLEKLLFMTFNAFFWLSGIAILITMIWMQVDKSILKVLVDREAPLVESAIYILIAMGGALVFIVGFLGCVGGFIENRFLLGLYIGFLVCIMIGELSAGIIALRYRDQVTDKVTDVLLSKLHDDDFFLSQSSEEDVVFTDFGRAMSDVQQRLECCGVHHHTDYEDSNFQQEYPNKSFPLTCCMLIPGTKLTDTMDLVDRVVDVESCRRYEDVFLYKVGCKNILGKTFSKHADGLIGTGIAMACLDLLGVLVTVNLIRMLGREEKEKEAEQGTDPEIKE